MGLAHRSVVTVCARQIRIAGCCTLAPFRIVEEVHAHELQVSVWFMDREMA